MPGITRRHLLSAATAASLSWRGSYSDAAAIASHPGSELRANGRRFTLDLNPGAVGIKANQLEAINLAARFGFESISPDPGFLSSLEDAGRMHLAELMESKSVCWGAASLTVDFRNDEATFREGVKALPAVCRAMQLANVTRIGTWLKPFHSSLTYMANFRQHARRLREYVDIMGDHGQRFGMKYVGPKTLWSSDRHSFIHSMNETKELIAEIDRPNVGFVLDSWHWYTAHETISDLLTLKNEDIVACDLNDAPAGLDIDKQIDNRRELPASTGIIDLSSFLKALVNIGYDGPVRAEPFNSKLNAMDNEAACQTTARAMQRAFSLVNH